VTHHHDIVQQAAAVRATLRLLRPHRLIGARKLRLGRPFDGGYVMLDRFEGLAAAYSFGIADDVSWDLEIAQRGIPVHQYDHSIARLPQEDPLFHWQPIRLTATVDDPWSATLETLVRDNGHAGSRDLLLKCDVEGAEWLVLAETPNAVLAGFRQIAIELHDLGGLADPDRAGLIHKALANLTAAHHVVHAHANNYAGWAVAGGVPVPEVIELTLARKDEGRFQRSRETFPTRLDMPNRNDAADLYLGRFAFD
jgi:hypothetical protein